MSVSVKISAKLIEQARQSGGVCNRSASKQIEYWAIIGKIVEENPDLPYGFIKDTLLAMQEANDGQVAPFEFG